MGLQGQEETGSFKPEGVHCIEGLPECPLLTLFPQVLKYVETNALQSSGLGVRKSGFDMICIYRDSCGSLNLFGSPFPHLSS